MARPATHRRSRVSVTFPSSVFCCMRHTLALTVDQCGATVPPNFYASNTKGQHPLFSSIAAFPPVLQLMMMPFHFFFIQSLSSFFSHAPTKQVFFESPFLTPTIRLSSQGSPTPRELSLQPPLGTQIPPPWVGCNHLPVRYKIVADTPAMHAVLGSIQLIGQIASINSSSPSVSVVGSRGRS